MSLEPLQRPLEGPGIESEETQLAQVQGFIQQDPGRPQPHPPALSTVLCSVVLFQTLPRTFPLGQENTLQETKQLFKGRRFAETSKHMTRSHEECQGNTHKQETGTFWDPKAGMTTEGELAEFTHVPAPQGKQLLLI